MPLAKHADETDQQLAGRQEAARRRSIHLRAEPGRIYSVRIDDDFGCIDTGRNQALLERIRDDSDAVGTEEIKLLAEGGDDGGALSRPVPGDPGGRAVVFEEEG